MGKRKQPFGYKMEFGDIVPEPEEAETVQSIYLRYLAGASFKVLAEALQEQGLPYDGEKQWNINMVARILQDKRYIGTDRFPPLIAEKQFLAVQERRKQMAPERTQTPAQKELRKLCGGAPPQSFLSSFCAGVCVRSGAICFRRSCAARNCSSVIRDGNLFVPVYR